MHRQWIISCAMMTISAAAFAAPVDDAKRAVAAADTKLASIVTDLQLCARDLTKQADVVATLTDRLDRQQASLKKLLPLIETAVTSADDELKAAQQAVSDHGQSLKKAESDLTAARADQQKRQADVTRAAQAERKAFEATEEFRAASARLDAAEAKLRARDDVLDRALAAEPKAAAAIAAATDAEATVSRLRAQSLVDDAAVAEASARWITASNAVSAIRAERYAGDVDHRALDAARAEAVAAQATMNAAFEHSILTRPGVADAQLSLRDAVAATKVAERAVADARDDLADAGKRLTVRRDALEQAKAIRAQFLANAVDAQTDLKRAQLAIRDSGQRLGALVGRLVDTRASLRDVVDAISKIRGNPTSISAP